MGILRVRSPEGQTIDEAVADARDVFLNLHDHTPSGIEGVWCRYREGPAEEATAAVNEPEQVWTIVVVEAGGREALADVRPGVRQVARRAVGTVTDDDELSHSGAKRYARMLVTTMLEPWTLRFPDPEPPTEEMKAAYAAAAFQRDMILDEIDDDLLPTVVTVLTTTVCEMTCLAAKLANTPNTDLKPTDPPAVWATYARLDAGRDEG